MVGVPVTNILSSMAHNDHTITPTNAPLSPKSCLASMPSPFSSFRRTSGDLVLRFFSLLFILLDFCLSLSSIWYLFSSFCPRDAWNHRYYVVKVLQLGYNSTDCILRFYPKLTVLPPCLLSWRCWVAPAGTFDSGAEPSGCWRKLKICCRLKLGNDHHYRGNFRPLEYFEAVFAWFRVVCPIDVVDVNLSIILFRHPQSQNCALHTNVTYFSS